MAIVDDIREQFINPWFKGGKYWEPKWMGNNAVTRSQGLTKEEAQITAGRLAANRAEQPVFYKPEGPGVALPVPEDLGFFGLAVDGVATSRFANQVYKVPNLASIVIDADGTVRPTNMESAAIIAARAVTGDAGWLRREDFTADELNDWEPLFTAAATIE